MSGFAAFMVLTTKELDQMSAGGCQVPGCTTDCSHEPLYLSPRCHPGPVRVSYFKGELTVICARCKSLVCTIAVQEGEG